MYISIEKIAEYFSCSKHHIYNTLTQLPDDELAKCRLNIATNDGRRMYRYKQDEVIKLFVDYWEQNNKEEQK